MKDFYTVSNLFLDRVEIGIFIKLIVLLHLLILLSMWSLKSSLESKIWPKCFWLAADWTFVLLNINGG